VTSPESSPQSALYRVGDLVVDTGRATVSRDGEAITLPRLSFDLLLALIEVAPRLASQDELMRRVWPGLVVGPETVSQRVKLLRDSLDDDPKTPRYILGVRGRGYRLLPDVARLEPPAASAATAAPAATYPAGPIPGRPWSSRRVLVAAAALIAAIAIIFLASRMGAPEGKVGTELATALPVRSVAVLAFEDRGSTDRTAFLAEGIPENVLHQLSRFPGLTVIARGSSFAFRDSDEDLRTIGRKLNVRYLLEGSVQAAGDKLRVTSSLVDAETGTSVWSMKFERPLLDVFAVEDEIAAEVARAMKISIDEGTAALAARGREADRNFDAYLAFLRGRALHSSQRLADLPAAIESLAAAIRHDPQFAAAYVLLARARVELAEREAQKNPQAGLAQAVDNALQLLDAAIELEPANGEAYIERGYLKAFDDIAAADADFRRGLELAPNSARGHEGLAAVLFQSVARRSEALAMIEKARRLDPLEPRLEVIKATYLGYGPGDAGQATELLQQVLERDPLYVPALVRLAEFRWSMQGRFAEAIQLAEQAVALDPRNEQAWRHIGVAYLEIDEPASAKAAFRGTGESSPSERLHLNLYREDWRAAGEAAYAMLAAGRPRAIDEWPIATAVRMHARATGDFERGISMLEAWTAVEWDADEPTIGDSLAQGMAVAGLADLLMISGQRDLATALAGELLREIDVQVRRYGRGEVWLDDAHALALALLDRPDEALESLTRQAQVVGSRNYWRFQTLHDPLFEPLRRRPEFQALVTTARGNAASEQAKVERMRADGLIPDRR